jgi:hypothetical protein
MKASKLMFLSIVMIASNVVLAAGGLSSGTTMVNDFVQWFYAIVGVGAGGYLLWKAVEAWSGRSDWLSFIQSCIYVAVAGGSLVLASYLWTAFK